MFYGVDGLLRCDIKITERIDLIAPQLHTDGMFFCQRKDIHDPSTHGKLSRMFHLGHIFIAQHDQFLSHFIQIHRLFQINGKNAPFIRGKGRHTVHQGIHSRYDRDRSMLNECLYDRKTLSGKSVAVNVRLIKEQISCRIIQSVFIKKLITLIDLLCPHLVKGNDQFDRHIITDAIDQMRFQTVDQPRYLVDAFIFF